MTAYYCDSGKSDDSGDGTTEATAKKTLPAGAALLSTGDTLYVKGGGADYALTSSLALGTAGVTIEGYGATPGDLGAMPVITSSTSSVNLVTTTVDKITLRNLKFTHTGSTRGAGVFPPSGVVRGVLVDGCAFDGCATAIDGDYSVGYTFLGLVVVGTEVANGTNHGISAPDPVIQGCNVHDNANDGIRRGNYPGDLAMTVVRTIVADNGAIGIDYSRDSAGTLAVVNCTVAGNAGDGIYVASSTTTLGLVLANNVVASNGGYGVNAAAAPALAAQAGNAFRANTSGARHANVPAGTNDITLTGDPFTDAAGGDYSPNDTAGAGAALRAAGYPGAFPGGLSTGYPDVGAVQSQATGGGGGGGSVLRVTFLGGFPG